MTFHTQFLRWDTHKNHAILLNTNKNSALSKKYRQAKENRKTVEVSIRENMKYKKKYYPHVFIMIDDQSIHVSLIVCHIRVHRQADHEYHVKSFKGSGKWWR